MSENGGKLERVTSLVLTLCAIFFVGLLAKREFFDRGVRAPQSQGSDVPVQVANWNELLAQAIPIRSPDAPVVVMEFADLECPACKRFNSRLEETVRDLHADVGLVMLHFPLPMHRFAKPAARALECASSMGAGAQFVDIAYAKQDSFGLKPWTGYAQEAGIEDTVAYSACVRDTTRIERVERGLRLGESLKLRGTPSVIINGWRFPTVPSDDQLRETIKALMAGRTPPGARTAGTD